MKKILVLSRRDITHPLAGGAGLYVHQIFRRLADRFSITVLAEGGPNRRPIEEIDGITYRHFHGKFHRMLLPVRYLAEFAGSTDILIDNADVAMPWFSPIYSRIPRIAIIYQVNGNIFRYELAKPLSQIAIKLEPTIYQAYRNTRIVTCSLSTKQDLIRLGLSAGRVSVVAPGVDDSFLRFERDGRRFEDPTIVCISRFRRYKGLSYAIQSMKHVLDRVPKAKLIIVGNGDETEVKNEASRTPYSHSIKILKRVPNAWNDEKRLLLSKAHLLLIPSVREGYGIVVIEANACGTPAVGWSVPGVQDAIVDGKTGFLVPFHDTTALADTIVNYFRSTHEKHEEISKGAIEWASQHSWETAAQKFEEAIDSII